MVTNHEERQTMQDVPGSSRTPRPWGTIYFLWSPRKRLVKIGYTSNLEQRRKALEKEHGSLDLIGAIPGDVPVEHRCHDIFKSHRCFGGEWFHWRDDMQRVIDHGPDGWEEYVCRSCLGRFSAWDPRGLCDPYCRAREYFNRRASVLHLHKLAGDLSIHDIRWALVL